MRDTVTGLEPASGGKGGTRARILSIAVDLFSEQGYEKTSLREISEQLGVTKAALYYHFKSKEDIVRSLVDEYFHQVDALVAWGRQQPRTPGLRSEVLSRYLDIVVAGHQVFRMLHQNQAALASLASAKERGELFRERLNGLAELLIEPGAGLEERVRATVAVSSVSFGWMLFQDQQVDQGELREAVLRTACQLAGCAGPASPTATAARTSGSTR